MSFRWGVRLQPRFLQAQFFAMGYGSSAVVEHGWGRDIAIVILPMIIRTLHKFTYSLLFFFSLVLFTVAFATLLRGLSCLPVAWVDYM